MANGPSPPPKSLTATPCPAHNRFAAISNKIAEITRDLAGELNTEFIGRGKAASYELRRHRRHWSYPQRYEEFQPAPRRTALRLYVWRAGQRSVRGLQPLLLHRHRSSLLRESLPRVRTIPIRRRHRSRGRTRCRRHGTGREFRR